MKIQPLHDRVIIERVESVNKTSGGVLLPDNAKEKPAEGIVIAVGPGITAEVTGAKKPLDVKEGDRVIFAKHAGVEIKLEGKVYLVLKEIEIHAILRD